MDLRTSRRIEQWDRDQNKKGLGKRCKDGTFVDFVVGDIEDPYQEVVKF